VTTVIVGDLRRVGYCRRGARAWFRARGLDWSRFVTQGIAAEALEATGDALVAPVVRAAQEREAGNVAR
jgi:hypothetical protein